MPEPSDVNAVIEDAISIVPVRDVAATVRFYADVLGFAPASVPDGESFATVRRGGAAIHLLHADDEQALHATAHNISMHVWVRGLDALYETLKPKLDALPKGRARPPFDRSYGVREFHVKDPDGCLLFFSEMLQSDG